MTMTQPADPADRVRDAWETVAGEMERIIVGQADLVRGLFICLVCGGHALIEGVPGVGKTLAAATLSRVLDLTWSRIQFTPDLMPADILGTNMINKDENGNRHFEFFKGPIFGQVILADEINRATPKTQSALLEAMQEERVTVFGTTYRLDPPFIVMATQNPLEMEGTYPLPEAQLDRFFFKLHAVYPDDGQLLEILDKTTESEPAEPAKVLDAPMIRELKALARQVPVNTRVKQYAVRIVQGTHPGAGNGLVEKYVRYGAGPRGAQALVMAGKVSALLNGRFHTAIEDIRGVAKNALRHRIILNLRGEAEGIDPDAIIDALLMNMSK